MRKGRVRLRIRTQPLKVGPVPTKNRRSIFGILKNCPSSVADPVGERLSSPWWPSKPPSMLLSSMTDLRPSSSSTPLDPHLRPPPPRRINVVVRDSALLDQELKTRIESMGVAASFSAGSGLTGACSVVGGAAVDDADVGECDGGGG
ncbi:hypothetical protein LINPERHAP1_LOCUS37747 [Linum perenne]